jgi:hypothetical protein
MAELIDFDGAYMRFAGELSVYGYDHGVGGEKAAGEVIRRA